MTLNAIYRLSRNKKCVLPVDKKAYPSKRNRINQYFKAIFVELVLRKSSVKLVLY